MGFPSEVVKNPHIWCECVALYAVRTFNVLNASSEQLLSFYASRRFSTNYVQRVHALPIAFVGGGGFLSFIHSLVFNEWLNAVYIFWMIDIIVDAPPYLLQPNFFERIFRGMHGSGDGSRRCFYFFEIGSPSTAILQQLNKMFRLMAHFVGHKPFSIRRNLFLAAIFTSVCIASSEAAQYQNFIYSYFSSK